MTLPLMVIALCLAFPGHLLAQGPDSDKPRRVVFTDIGYARTWDDEGYLGRGGALRAGVGYRVTRRLTVQALIERVRYYRDIEYLTFDGRFVFAGGELAFQSRRPKVRPFITIGAGIMRDDRTWVHKTTIDPWLPRVETSTEHRCTLSMFTSSAGLDVMFSPQVSVRAGVRLHGLLDTGDDLAPHTSLQPTIGAAFRW